MKRIVKRFFSYVLCLCLCMTALTVHAEGETGETEITFTAALDKTSIYESGVDQTVVLTVNADQPVTLAAIGATVEGESPLVLTAITNTDTRIDFAGNINVDNGKIDWYDSNLTVFDNVTNIAVATFTVPAGTEAGSYELGLKELILLDGQGTPIVNDVNITATLEIEKVDAVTGYTAGISASENSIEVDESVNILVTADHASEEAFAAAEITVGYDSSVLRFDDAAFTTSYPNVSADATVADTLKLVDHGASKSFGDTGYVYMMPFKAIASADNTNVTLNYAGFATQTEAETKDLANATYHPKNVTLNISEKSLSVVLPNDGILTGDTEVAYGEDYTFTLADKGNYNYEITKVMMGDTDVTANLVDNGNGTYTIPNVTGALEITATRTAKSYTVSFEGTGAEETSQLEGNVFTATYDVPYMFKLPTITDEYVYELGSVFIGGIAYTGYSLADGTYTIPGTDVKGDIIITVNRSENPTGNVTVTIEGIGDASGAATVQKGSPYTLTLTEEAGYIYEVTATMGGISTGLTKGTDADGKTTYTIGSVTGAIVFNVAKNVDTSGITVSQYITLNGTIMWLVENTTAVAEGKVPTYNGQNMFWSSKYGVDAEDNGTNDGAYGYLIISESAQDVVLAAAKTALGIATGSAETVAYDSDVNGTSKVDASDAQLVWNMYNSVYNNFTNDVTVAKFLEADVNGNKSVGMDDATAIISEILN